MTYTCNVLVESGQDEVHQYNLIGPWYFHRVEGRAVYRNAHGWDHNLFAVDAVVGHTYYWPSIQCYLMVCFHMSWPDDVLNNQNDLRIIILIEIFLFKFISELPLSSSYCMHYHSHKDFLLFYLLFSDTKCVSSLFPEQQNMKYLTFSVVYTNVSSLSLCLRISYSFSGSS